MKQIIFLLLTFSLVFTSCDKPNKENPDTGFNEMYWWDGNSASTININNNTNDEKKTLNKQLDSPSKGDMVAIMETSMGTMKIKLFPKETPKTYENFTTLAKKGYYEWIIFHRVINNFMIQGWDPSGTWRGWESAFWWDFEDEPNIDLKNIRWALSMANRWPNTNGSQFFIVHAPATPFLDWYQNGVKTCGTVWMSCHTVFGQVYEWIEIIDAIAWVKTNWADKPLEDVVIKSIKIEKVK